MFGAPKQQTSFGGSLLGNTGTTQTGGGGLFGNSQTQQPQQSTGGLFGQSAQPQQTGGLFGQPAQSQQPGGLPGQNAEPAQGGGLFSGLGQNTQQAGSGGLFGNTGQATQPSQGGGLFSGLGQSTQQAGNGGLFANPGQGQQQQQQQNAFGQSNAQQNGGGGLFGNSTNQQQRSLFQHSTQQPLSQSQAQLNSSLWLANNGYKPREKSIPDQITAVIEKWNIHSPNCAFKYYFYNKVGDNAPFYQPGPNEDPKEWEEALQKKPGPGLIPVLCVGFEAMGKRIETQHQILSQYNTRLHEINDSLSAMLSNHDTKTSIRAMDAKRKHVVLKQRCLALATKVQILRNRGYAMTAEEEALKAKLLTLDKGVSDPGLGARAEEIWSRMITVQERAKVLRSEIEKSGHEQADILDEDIDARAKKILEDYQTQLAHLKNELDKIQKEYEEWEKEQPAANNFKASGY